MRAMRHARDDGVDILRLGLAVMHFGDVRPLQPVGQAFVRAADSAPASEWRARAEQQIGLLGL